MAQVPHPQVAIVIGANQADPMQRSVLHDLLINVVTQRAQLDLEPSDLPILIYDASHPHQMGMLDRLGVNFLKLVSLGVCEMDGSTPQRLLTLQGPVTDVNASVSVTMRRIQYLFNREGITPPVPGNRLHRDPMPFEYKYVHGGATRILVGTVDAPLGLWQDLAQLQPPVGGHGAFGLIADDAMLGQPSGFGLRTLGRLARQYMHFDKVLYVQPFGQDRFGVQSGTFTSPGALNDTSLGTAILDVRADLERDLENHLHFGAHRATPAPSPTSTAGPAVSAPRR